MRQFQSEREAELFSRNHLNLYVPIRRRYLGYAEPIGKLFWNERMAWDFPCFLYSIRQHIAHMDSSPAWRKQIGIRHFGAIRSEARPLSGLFGISFSVGYAWMPDNQTVRVNFPNVLFSYYPTNGLEIINGYSCFVIN